MFCFKLKGKESVLSTFLSHAHLRDVVIARKMLLLFCLKTVETGQYTFFLLA